MGCTIVGWSRNLVEVVAEGVRTAELDNLGLLARARSLEPVPELV